MSSEVFLRISVKFVTFVTEVKTTDFKGCIGLTKAFVTFVTEVKTCYESASLNPPACGYYFRN